MSKELGIKSERIKGEKKEKREYRRSHLMLKSLKTNQYSQNNRKEAKGL